MPFEKTKVLPFIISFLLTKKLMHQANNGLHIGISHTGQ